MENPELCKSCRKCCTRPSLTTMEYMVMTAVVGQDAMLHSGPKYMEQGIWMFKSGCPAKTDNGCALTHAQRPLMCRLYPWIPVPVYGPDQEDAEVRLFLAAHDCPNWKDFGDNYPQAKEEFDNG